MVGPLADGRSIRPSGVEVVCCITGHEAPVRGRGLRYLILVLRPYVDAAINIDGLAGDIVAVFDKVADGAGDLVRFSEAAEGDLFFELLLGFLGDVGDHVGLDKPGADGVHGDATAGQFLGRGLGKAEEASLGRRVVRLADVTRLADEGAHVDDLAPALLYHVRQHRVDRVEGAVEVHLNDLVPIIHGELLQRTVDVDAGVVDQDVYTIILFYRPIYECLGLLRIRNVGLYRDGLTTALRDLLYQLLGRLLAPRVVDDDFGPPIRQLLRYGLAQTPARAGHDNNGFVQGAHTILLFTFACELEFIDLRNQAQTRYHTRLSSATRGGRRHLDAFCSWGRFANRPHSDRGNRFQATGLSGNGVRPGGDVAASLVRLPQCSPTRGRWRCDRRPR